MFRKILISMLLVICFTVISGCTEKKEKLYIYNWSDYILEDVLREFEKENNCEIVYDVYSSNEEMFAKLKAGGTGYDIVFPSISHVELMIREGMVDKIDKSKLSNFKYLDKEMLEKITFDPECDYNIPYVISSTGIAVNKKYVKDYKHSWSIFERSDLKGRMTLLDDMREVMGAALIYLGYSVNSTNKDELGKAKETVIKWKQNIIKFDAEAFGKGFANGDFWIVQGYGENIFLEMDDSMKKDVDYFIPDEGGILWIDSMVILKDGKNKEMSHKFINYIHEPQVMARIIDHLGSASVNREALKYVTDKPMYDKTNLSRCEVLKDLGDDIELYNKIWQEIRVGK
ncbi:extracellular solute-binding protein [Candidatus Parcubacteria bacterium]|nr:MAG: extracellular solute-binding protein [Candidatus Parcubacteria bacterium]